MCPQTATDCEAGEDSCPPANSLAAALELDVDIASIEAGTDERDDFESSFRTDMAAALGGISADRIQIISIEGGSVIVKFVVLPAANGRPIDVGLLVSTFSSSGVSIAGATTTSAVDEVVLKTPPGPVNSEPEPEVNA